MEEALSQLANELFMKIACPLKNGEGVYQSLLEFLQKAYELGKNNNDGKAIERPKAEYSNSGNYNLTKEA